MPPKRRATSTTTPRQVRSIFENAISTEDGHVNMIYYHLKALRGIQDFANQSAPSDTIDSMIDGALEKLKNAVDEYFVASNKQSGRKPWESSLRTRLIARSLTYEASKRFRATVQSPMDITALVMGEDEQANLKAEWDSQMENFFEDLMRDSMVPGTGIPCESWQSAPLSSLITEFPYMQISSDDNTKKKGKGVKKTIKMKNETQVTGGDDAVAQSGYNLDGLFTEENSDDCNTESELDSDNPVPPDHCGNNFVKPKLEKYIAIGPYARSVAEEALGDFDHDLPNPNDVATRLRTWQSYGAKVLETMLRGPLKGAILADGMGLGKTLTAMAVALPDRNEPYQGPALIVVPKSLVSTWVEQLNFHCHDDRRPSIFILKDKDTTTNEFMDGQYDFVLTSYHFLLGRHQELELAEIHGCLLDQSGAMYTDHVLEKSGFSRGTMATLRKPLVVNNPLGADALGAYGYRFRLVVFDEAHILKNHEGAMHLAAKALSYDRVLMLTGTPMPNKWYDAFGLIDLLPERIFEDFKDFVRSFSSFSGPRPSAAVKGLGFASFLESIMVARPQNVMQLPGLQEHDVDAKLPPDTVLSIAILAEQFSKLACMGSDDPMGTGNPAAMSKAVEAQMLAVSPLLARRDPKKLPVHRCEKWLSQKGIGLLEVTNEQLLAFVRRVEKFRKDDEQVDPTYQPGKCEIEDDKEYSPNDEDDDDEDEDDDEISPGLKRDKWISFLQETNPKEYIDSPRVKAIINTVMQIHKDQGREKIIIFSRFLRVLDLLRFAFESVYTSRASKGNAPQVLEYNGQMSVDTRDTVRRQVQEGPGPMIILITSGAGGMGITLTAASHVILAEPAWTKTEELQLLSRCYRQGQTQTVHVWRIISHNSAMEAYIRQLATFKFKEVSSVMNDVVKEDRRDVVADFIDEKDFNRLFDKFNWPEYRFIPGTQ